MSASSGGRLPLAVFLALDAFKPGVGYQPTRKIFASA
jgi:hypothetical protein